MLNGENGYGLDCFFLTTNWFTILVHNRSIVIENLLNFGVAKFHEAVQRQNLANKKEK